MSKDTQKNPVGRPLKFKNVGEVEVLIEEYFNTKAFMEMGDNTIFAPTMSGLAYHLDIDRKTLLNYSNKDEYFLTIKKARERIGEALEQRLYGNNVTGIIFNLKNNFDWKDKTEVKNTHSLEDCSDEELDSRIRELTNAIK